MERESEAVPIQKRWAVVMRILAAIPANYLLTALISACLARSLPMAPAEATVTAMLASFVIFAVVALLAFSVHSVVRLWSWLVGLAGLAALLLWLSFMAEGRI